MIRRPTNIPDMVFDLFQRVDLTHRSCLLIVAELRNPAAIIMTGVGVGNGAAGWVQHFTSERARLISLRDKLSTIVQRVYPEMVPAITDYLSDVPLIVADIQTAIDRHGGRNEPLTNGERSTLANAIEARVET